MMGKEHDVATIGASVTGCTAAKLVSSNSGYVEA
jgi:hypothetical protein